MSKEQIKSFERVNEIIQEIYTIAKDRLDWYKDSKIATRIGWLKRYE